MKRLTLVATVVAAALAFSAPQAGAVAGPSASCIAQHNSAEASSGPGVLAAEVREFAGPGFGTAISQFARAPRDACPPE
jgi:hypothetical protein